MSGGSLNYVYSPVADAAHDIRGESARLHRHPERAALWRAFADHLELVSKALHACEWVMSGDWGDDQADRELRAVLGADAARAALLAQAREITAALAKMGEA